MEKPTGEDSFSWPYRIGFRITYALLHVMGPATQSAESDPQVLAKKEYERRRELHRAWKADRRAT